MISVIIPTMLREPRLWVTLAELSDHPLVGEIIVIDNSGTERLLDSLDFLKVKWINEGRNTYVNPAWNKGVSLAKHEILWFLNDDFWFDWEYLKDIVPHVKPEVGMVGTDITRNPSFSVSAVRSQGTVKGIRPYAYACSFFIHRESWVPIPEELLIWGGDDWLFYQDNGKRNFKIKGLNPNGSISKTVEDPELRETFNPIKNRDVEVLRKMVAEGKLLRFI